MSLYGALFSGVSGLTAQSSAMGAISDNITNVSTIGYKGTTVNFQTLVTKQTSSTFYSAGGVQSKPRQQTDVQGLLQASTSSTDVAMSGGGFFVVNQANTPGISDPYLYTRAGSFIQDDQGFLKNSAGYYLQGWPTDASGTVVPSNTALTVTNQNIISTDYLESINLNRVGGTAASTTTVAIGANLPATGVNSEAGDTHKNDIEFFDSLGSANNMSVVYTKTVNSNEWDVSIAPPPGTAVATLYDNQTTKGVYASSGLIEFTAIPAAGSTVKIGLNSTTAQTYTFVNGAAGANQIQIDSGQTLSQVVSALVTSVKTNDKAFSVDTNRISVKSGVTSAIEFVESGVGDIYVDLSNTLNATGAAVTNQTGTFTVQQQDNAYSDFTMLRFGGSGGTTLPANNDTMEVNGLTYTFDMTAADALPSTTPTIKLATSMVNTITVPAAGVTGEVYTYAAATDTSVARTDTLTIAHVVGDTGDIYTATINGIAISYTATVTDTATTIATNLSALINANTSLLPKVTAVPGGTAIVLTSDAAGTDYTFATSVTDGGGAGGVPSIALSAQTANTTGAIATYTAVASDTTAADIAAGLTAAINASSNTNTIVTATTNGTGDIVLTSTEAYRGRTTAATTIAASVANTPTEAVTTNFVAPAAIDTLAKLMTAIEASIEGNDTVLATTGSRVQTFDISNDGVADTLYIATVNNDANSVVTAGITAASQPTQADLTAYTSTTIPVATAAGIIFTAGGVPSAFNVSEVEILNFADGAQDMSNATGQGSRITLDFGAVNESTGLTQFGDEFTQAFSTQNGSKFGTFAGVTIGSDGLVTALFDNGETRKIFQIPVATFVNPNQLDSKSGNVWSATQNSGDYTLRVADSGSAGQVVQSALEASTVDIGAEFTNMIVVQRAYSASTKIISTADQMLEELMRVKR